MVRVMVVYILPGLAVAGGSGCVRSMQLDPATSKQVVTWIIVAGLAWMFVAAFKVPKA